MRNVLIPTKLDKVCQDLLRARGFTVVQDATTELATLIKAHPETNTLIVRSEKVPAEILDALPNLRVVIRAGAGYDSIDVKHARRRGVDVMNTPGANANGVAEEVIAMVLSAYRHVAAADASTRAGGWEKTKFMGRELTGKTVGIIGMGNIGRTLVRRLSGFETKILAYDPILSASRAEELGVALATVEKIFTESDVISLHVPETDETRGMVNADLLKLAKTGAVIVNCARAGVVNESDLRAVKAEKKLVYCTDVYPKDVAGPKPVADIADLMLPHLGASTHEANYTAAKRAAEQLVAYVEHGVNTAVVNKPLPTGLDEEYQLLAYYLTRVAHGFLGHEAPSRVEVSFYGGLAEFANWLMAPIVLGLGMEKFDPLFDYNQAEDLLKEKGIEFVQRLQDDTKKYGKAMTIDLLVGAGTQLRRVSVRGTIAEGNPTVSRINDFDRLYFEPRGNSVMVIYQDRPGMLAKITGVMAEHDINIEDIRAPHDPRTGDSMAILRLNQPANPQVLHEIMARAKAKDAIALAIA